VIRSHQQTIGTTAVPLEKPDVGIDYRQGFSVIIKHSDEDPIFVGGSDAQQWDIAADSPFPINNIDDGEVIHVKASNAGVVIKTLWQGL
jgi:hypothetical protein